MWLAEEVGWEDEPGAIGVKGLLEKVGGGPEGVDLLLEVELAVFVKIFAFSKFANDGWEIELGAWVLVGEANGSFELTEDADWFPRSASKSNDADDFGVEFFDPLLVLVSGPPTDPVDCDAETFGLETDEVIVGVVLLVSPLGVDALEEFALDVCGGMFFRATIGSI